MEAIGTHLAQRRRTGAFRVLAADLFARYRDGRRIERLCYRIGALLIAVGLLHLLVQGILGGPWTGPVSWRKPFAFGLAFGVTLISVALASTRVVLRERLRQLCLGAFATACVVEVIAITVQAWRGVSSHFNTTSPLNTVFAMGAAFGGGVLVLSTLALTISAMRRQDTSTSRATRIAVRWGFGTLLLAMLIGAAMIAIGVREAATNSLEQAYWSSTMLVPAHAVAMQGILVLPGLAWLSRFTAWPSSKRDRTVVLGTAGYLLCTLVFVIEAALRIDPLSEAPLVASVLALLGLLVLIAAGAYTIHATLRGIQESTTRSDNGIA